MIQRTRGVVAALVGTGVIAGGGAAHAGGILQPCEVLKVLPPATDGRMGFDVAIDGDVAVIGARDDNDNGSNAGAVYVYRLSGFDWQLEQKIVPIDGDADDHFGVSVAIDADYIVVGASQDEDAASFAGSAYVFKHNGVSWVQDQKLLASEPSNSDQFGWSVDIDGSAIIVGSLRGEAGVTNSGSAEIFRLTKGWSFEQQVTASDAADGDFFGYDVAIEGDVAVVGANSAGPGAAYVYRYSGTWSQEEKLAAVDPSGFGLAVAISGDAILVGAPGDPVDGAAFVYRYDGSWNLEAELLGLSGGVQQFGASVDLVGDVALIGDPDNNFNGSLAGAAYVFRFEGTTWNEDAFLSASDGDGGDKFGYAVAFSGDAGVAGALFDEAVSLEGGSAYFFFGLSDFDCDGDGAADSCSLLLGDRTDYDGNLVPDSCATEFFAYNLTLDTFHASISEAIGVAAPGHFLIATSALFDDEQTIDFNDKALSLASLAGITQASGGTYSLADGAVLSSQPGFDISIGGELRVEDGDAADVNSGAMFTMVPNGDIVVRPGASLYVDTVGGATLSGETTVMAGGTLSFDFDMTLDGDLTAFSNATIDIDGSLTCLGTMALIDGATLSATAVFNNATLQMLDVDFIALLNNSGPGAHVIVSGHLIGDVFNFQQLTCVGDTLVLGDYWNDGTTTVQLGTLVIIGTLTNNGSIIGDVVGGVANAGGGTQTGDGLSISGDLVMGASAALSMPDPVWRVQLTGDYDVAIADSSLFDMGEATLKLTGATQNVEMMSFDVGADRIGLDGSLAGSFPFGTLHVTGGTVANLADNHDNDGMGQGPCEALYATNLIVDAGGTLNTLGCPVYYETAQIDGAVDDPGNLIELPPACIWDVDGDNSVNVVDFLLLLAQWGTDPGGPPDFDGDGDVGVTDFLELLANWGSCP